jgi:uncharacterized membrane protein YedE/YeeE
MIPHINNAIDILWLLLGLIAFGTTAYVALDWKFIFEAVLMLLAIVWIALRFWMREAWIAIKKKCKKRKNWMHIDDHELFI